MQSDNHPAPLFAHLKDAGVFVVTVAACTLFLSMGSTIYEAAPTIAETPPALAMPQVPTPLFPVFESECIMPGATAADSTGWTAAFETPSPGPPYGLLERKAALAGDSDSEPAPQTVSKAPSGPERAVPHEPAPYHGIIVQVAGRYEVDPHLIRAIILAESGYNPKAKSKKGARGLMQLMPSTAKALGVQDIYDPEENIDGGVRYFRSLLDRFNGDVQLALAAYNAGSRHVRNYEGVPPFKATRRYIKKVLNFHKKFKMEKIATSRRMA